MITITDIAAALGLDPSTVSRSLSGSPRVKEKTRNTVLNKARELGYERNIPASNLRRGHSNIVGMIVPRITREFFAKVIGGAESVLNAAGFNVLICQTVEDTLAEIKALRTLKNNQVAGILLSHAIQDSDSSHIRAIIGNTPLVQFDRVFYDLPGAKVVGANFEGAYLATRHLIEAGYKRIGQVAGYMTSQLFIDRLSGYRAALEEAGLPYDESIVYYDSIVEETGYRAGVKALDAGCDALFCAGAFSALGAIKALQERGISIPHDFGIVGTSNEAFTSLMSPSMSTLSQHPFKMGQTAAHSFLDQSDETVVIPMELNARQSTARRATP